MKLNHLRPFLLSAVALVATVPAAFALDATDFADKLKAAYGYSLPAGSTLTFGTSAVDGSNVSFDGITVQLPGTDQAPFTIDTQLKFTGVTEQPDGSYLADQLAFPDVDYKFEGGELSARNIVLKHIYVANTKTPDVVTSSRLFGDASIGPIVLTFDGTPALTIDSVTATSNFKPSQTAPDLAEINSTGYTTGLKFDMSGAKDQESLAQAKALDLVTGTGKALESTSWSLKDGHLDISEISLDIDKVGKLKFGLDMTGYTPAFLNTLSKMSQTLGDMGGSSSSADQSQQTAMLLASLQTLFMNSASLRFDDASLTNKLLDLAAKEGNVDRAALIDQLVAQLPAEMNSDPSSQVPVSLVQTVQAATRAYLTDPHSIEVRLAPKVPLGVMGIVAAAMQPASMVEQIGLKLLVNDKEITAADAAKETGTAPAATDATPAGDDNSSATPAGDDDSSAPADDTSAGSGDDSGQPAADDAGGDASGSDADRLDNTHTH